MESNIELAKEILRLNIAKDSCGILALYDATINPDSSEEHMRKAYHMLSVKIHPDKLGPVFEQASEAFQALVSAYEHMMLGDLYLEENTESKAGGPLRIRRSNEGCHRKSPPHTTIRHKTQLKPVLAQTFPP